MTALDLDAIRIRAERVIGTTWSFQTNEVSEVGREYLSYAVAAMAGDDVPALLCEIEHLRARLGGVIPEHTCAAALNAGDYVVKHQPILYGVESYEDGR